MEDDYLPNDIDRLHDTMQDVNEYAMKSATGPAQYAELLITSCAYMKMFIEEMELEEEFADFANDLEHKVATQEREIYGSICEDCNNCDNCNGTFPIIEDG